MNQLKVIKIRNVYTLNMKMKVKKPTCNFHMLIQYVHAWL